MYVRICTLYTYIEILVHWEEHPFQDYPRYVRVYTLYIENCMQYNISGERHIHIHILSRTKATVTLTCDTHTQSHKYIYICIQDLGAVNVYVSACVCASVCVCVSKCKLCLRAFANKKKHSIHRLEHSTAKCAHTFVHICMHTDLSFVIQRPSHIYTRSDQTSQIRTNCNSGIHSVCCSACYSMCCSAYCSVCCNELQTASSPEPPHYKLNFPPHYPQVRSSGTYFYMLRCVCITWPTELIDSAPLKSLRWSCQPETRRVRLFWYCLKNLGSPHPRPLPRLRLFPFSPLAAPPLPRSPPLPLRTDPLTNSLTTRGTPCLSRSKLRLASWVSVLSDGKTFRSQGQSKSKSDTSRTTKFSRRTTIQPVTQFAHRKRVMDDLYIYNLVFCQYLLALVVLCQTRAGTGSVALDSECCHTSGTWHQNAFVVPIPVLP